MKSYLCKWSLSTCDLKQFKDEEEKKDKFVSYKYMVSYLDEQYCLIVSFSQLSLNMKLPSIKFNGQVLRPLFYIGSLVFDKKKVVNLI